MNLNELTVSHPKAEHQAHLAFQKIVQPTGEVSYIPADISIAFPNVDIATDRLHLLVYIPWNDKYLQLVPQAYRNFFSFVLPHLHPRTTNVHTALSLSFVPELARAFHKPVDLHIATIAIILHDCGWSKVSHHDIADSLDYSGIAFTPNAAEAKLKHTIHGAAHALQLLSDYTFDPPLTLEEKQFICDIIRYHEKPWEYGGNKNASELLLTCEADRLWPFTHQNFWLDTIRKGVDPLVYIKNVAAAANEIPLTEEGKTIARRLVTDRQAEITAYKSFLELI